MSSNSVCVYIRMITDRSGLHTVLLPLVIGLVHKLTLGFFVEHNLHDALQEYFGEGTGH